MSSDSMRSPAGLKHGQSGCAAATPGILFVVSAPSGSGKSTLVKRVLREVPGLRFSISHTTRPPRDGEQNGVDYFFVSLEEFQTMIRDGKFVEHAMVYGNHYGTTWREIEAARATGEDVLLDIDVQGAAQVRERFGPDIPSVFVLPPSYEILEQRLRGRSSDGDEEIRRRLEMARREINQFDQYDYAIVNDNVDRAAEVLRSIIAAHRARRSRLKDKIVEIIQTFGGHSE